jgi:diguanylate cyclase (GGDEF)-like protein
MVASLPVLGNFEAASRAVLSFLHEKMGFGLWMVTRKEEDDWIVLQSEDHGYGVREGTVFRWADSFCSRMVEGRGPRVAPDSEKIPAYAAAPIGHQVKIGAYVGVPLRQANGELFGTLCAIDPLRQPEAITKELELVELLAGLLSTLLVAELHAANEYRRAERAEAEALTDGLTSLYNRRGWDRLLRAEEDRCRRYGHPACVLVADLNELKRINDNEGHDAGDAIIVRTGTLLRKSARAQDVVARLGGDEFGILGVECDRRGAEALISRVRADFRQAGVEIALGMAMREPGRGLEAAWARADEAMFEDKRRAEADPA